MFERFTDRPGESSSWHRRNAALAAAGADDHQFPSRTVVPSGPPTAWIWWPGSSARWGTRPGCGCWSSCCTTSTPCPSACSTSACPGGRVSAHLACLAGCGYVRVRRAGRFAWYRVADPRVAGLVTLARSLAAAGYRAASHRPRPGQARSPGVFASPRRQGNPGAMHAGKQFSARMRSRTSGIAGRHLQPAASAI